MSIGYQLAKDFENGTLCGWAEVRKPGLLAQQFQVMGNPLEFQVTRKSNTTDKKMFLHWIVRKLLGKDTPNYPQQVGDCVSFGAKNGTEYVTCTEILGNVVSKSDATGESVDELIKTGNYKFRPIFPPYFYGTGRVYVGGGQMGYSDDGSLGVWMADAVRKYGALFADEPGVPAYSGNIARAWGDPNPAPDLDKWKDKASHFPVKKTQQIKSWDDLVNAVANDLCPCPTASNVGYSMDARSDGFHPQTTSWGHQMCFIGVCNNSTDPYALILNNWGDVHGHLKDFDTKEDLPVGILRVRRKDAEKHIKAGETYAYGDFDADKSALIEKALFRVMG